VQDFFKSVSFAPEKSTIKKKAVVFSSLRLDIDWRRRQQRQRESRTRKGGVPSVRVH